MWLKIIEIMPRLYSSFLFQYIYIYIWFMTCLKNINYFWHFWQKSMILQLCRGFTHRCVFNKSMILEIFDPNPWFYNYAEALLIVSSSTDQCFFDIFDKNLWFLRKIHDFSTQFWHYSSLQIWLYHPSLWYNTVGIT